MSSLSPLTFRRIVFASAAYDLVVTVPFATPWSFGLLHQQLTTINQQLGGAPLPLFTSLHVLIACLFGSVVIMWSILRLSDPQPRFGRFDAATRSVFFVWMTWALVATSAPILWLFLVPELLWGLVQWLPVQQKAAVASNN